MVLNLCPLMEVLYGFMYQGLWDDELDLVVVLVLLDPPIQQSVLVLHVYPVGRWCGRRDSKSLQNVVIILRAGEFLSGEGRIWL